MEESEALQTAIPVRMPNRSPEAKPRRLIAEARMVQAADLDMDTPAGDMVPAILRDRLDRILLVRVGPAEVLRTLRAAAGGRRPVLVPAAPAAQARRARAVQAVARAADLNQSRVFGLMVAGRG